MELNIKTTSEEYKLKRQFYRGVYADQPSYDYCSLCGSSCGCCCGCQYGGQFIQYISCQPLEFVENMLKELDTWCEDMEKLSPETILFIKMGANVQLPQYDEFEFVSSNEDGRSRDSMFKRNFNINKQTPNIKYYNGTIHPYDHEALRLALENVELKSKDFLDQDYIPKTIDAFIGYLVKDPILRTRFANFNESNSNLKKKIFYISFFSNYSTVSNISETLFFKYFHLNPTYIKSLYMRNIATTSLYKNLNKYLDEFFKNQIHNLQTEEIRNIISAISDMFSKVENISDEHKFNILQVPVRGNWSLSNQIVKYFTKKTNLEKYQNNEDFKSKIFKSLKYFFYGTDSVLCVNNLIDFYGKEPIVQEIKSIFNGLDILSNDKLVLLSSLNIICLDLVDDLVTYETISKLIDFWSRTLDDGKDQEIKWNLKKQIFTATNKKLLTFPLNVETLEKLTLLFNNSEHKQIEWIALVDSLFKLNGIESVFLENHQIFTKYYDLFHRKHDMISCYRLLSIVKDQKLFRELKTEKGSLIINHWKFNECVLNSKSFPYQFEIVLKFMNDDIEKNVPLVFEFKDDEVLETPITEEETGEDELLIEDETTAATTTTTTKEEDEEEEENEEDYTPQNRLKMFEEFVITQLKSNEVYRVNDKTCDIHLKVLRYFLNYFASNNPTVHTQLINKFINHQVIICSSALMVEKYELEFEEFFKLNMKELKNSSVDVILYDKKFNNISSKYLSNQEYLLQYHETYKSGSHFYKYFKYRENLKIDIKEYESAVVSFATSQPKEILVEILLEWKNDTPQLANLFMGMVRSNKYSYLWIREIYDQIKNYLFEEGETVLDLFQFFVKNDSLYDLNTHNLNQFLEKFEPDYGHTADFKSFITNIHPPLQPLTESLKKFFKNQYYNHQYFNEILDINPTTPIPFLSNYIYQLIIEFIYRDITIESSFKIEVSKVSKGFFSICQNILSNHHRLHSYIPIKSLVNVNSPYSLFSQIPKHIKYEELMFFSHIGLDTQFLERVESLSLDTPIILNLKVPTVIKNLKIFPIKNTRKFSSLNDSKFFLNSIASLISNSPLLETIKIIYSTVSQFLDTNFLEIFKDFKPTNSTLVKFELLSQKSCPIEEFLKLKTSNLNFKFSLKAKTNEFTTPVPSTNNNNNNNNLVIPNDHEVLPHIYKLFMVEDLHLINATRFQQMTGLRKLILNQRGFLDISNFLGSSLKLLEIMDKEIPTIEEVSLCRNSSSFGNWRLKDFFQIQPIVIEIFEFLNQRNMHIKQLSIYSIGLAGGNQHKLPLCSDQFYKGILSKISHYNSFLPTSNSKLLTFRNYNY